MKLKFLFLIAHGQAKKRQAVLANKRAKASVVQVPDPEDNNDNAVLNANAALAEFRCCPDLAAEYLSDPHFAVSEELVDEARTKHSQSGAKGSWLEMGYQAFKQQHGHMQGTSGDTVQLPMQDEEGEDEEGEEEHLCEYGLCQAKQSRQYAQNCHRLFEQVKNLLRQCRDSRKKNGFMPNHIVLLWCRDEVIIDVALLIRVMFRPFDGTAILLERCPNDSAIAKVKVKDDGMLEFFSLPRLLGKYAEHDDVVLKSAPYKTESLLEIRLDIEAVQSFDQLIPVQSGGNASSDEESSDGETELKARLNLLRRAAGGNQKQRGRGRGVQKKGKQAKGPVMPPKPKDDKKARAKAKAKATTGAVNDFSDGDDPNEPGAAGEVHDSLVTTWSQALEDQQGPIPLESSSLSLSSSKKKLQLQLPQVQYQYQKQKLQLEHHRRFQLSAGFILGEMPKDIVGNFLKRPKSLSILARVSEKM